MIVAELRVITIGEGTSLEKPVEHVLKVLDERGLKHEVGALGTTIEADNLGDILDAVKECQEVLRKDADRIITELAIDERLDKDETIQSLHQVK